LTRRGILARGAVVIVAACLAVAAALLVEGMPSDASEESVTAESLESLISPDRYRQAVATLASEEMEGRRVGTPGGEAAAQFVEARFRARPTSSATFPEPTQRSAAR